MLILTRLAVLVLPVLSLVSASHIRQQHSRHHNLKRNFEVVERDIELRDDQTPAPRSELNKRETFSGDGTYFYVGLGACGQTSVDSDLMVALNYQQYGSGYPGPQCFEYITIVANGITVSGVEILDECPSCPNVGDLDMSPGLFQKFVPGQSIAVVGEISIEWWFEGSGSGSTTTTTSSTSKWVAPTSTWTPTTTSTWVAPTSTWTPPSSTSTWVAPSSTWTPPSSTSTWVAPSSTSSSSTWSAPSSSTTSWWSSSSSTASSTTSHNSTSSYNPYIKASSYAPSASASSSSNSTTASSSSETTDSSSTTSTYSGNLEAFNGLVTNYGQLVVVAAGGHQ